MTKKHLLISGHGYNDPGATGNGENERDFIRREITPRVAKHINATKGHKAEVYNPDWNMYADSAAGQRKNKPYGMYKYYANTFASMTEFHLDAASASATGGHVIIYSGFVPDAIDTRIGNAIKKYVGLRGGVAISKRNDLLQVNVAANRGINYRLVELGFITNANDMKNIKNNVEAYCKALADAITGGASEIKPTNSKAPEPAKKPASKPKTTTTKPKTKSISQLADEVLVGKHGNGDARKKSLGSNYAKVQAEINRRLGVKSASKKKSVNTIVNEVIAGKWGNGQDRFNRLLKAGYDPNVIQREVNKRY